MDKRQAGLEFKLFLAKQVVDTPREEGTKILLNDAIRSIETYLTTDRESLQTVNGQLLLKRYSYAEEYSTLSDWEYRRSVCYAIDTVLDALDFYSEPLNDNVLDSYIHALAYAASCKAGGDNAEALHDAAEEQARRLAREELYRLAVNVKDFEGIRSIARLRADNLSSFREHL